MLLAPVAAVALTALLTPLLAAWARRRNFLDIPNHRSSHVVATPRIGGAAIVLGVIGGAVVVYGLGGGDRGMTTVLCGALGVALLGLVDDFRHLPALVRLAVQTVIAAAVVLVSPTPVLAQSGGPLAALLIVLWLVASINAYNFMDGIDGIAGAQALVAGAGWVIVGLLAGAPQVAVLGLLIAAASAGFLLHNWHPAKVFMGDAGSGFFGFLFAALPLAAPGNRPSLWLCAALLIWPFLADTGFTLLRRASRRENVLSAHRSHIYQRMVLSGRSHRDVSAVYAGLALLGAFAAVSIVFGYRPALLLALATIAVAGAGTWWSAVSREEREVPRRSTNQK